MVWFPRLLDAVFFFPYEKLSDKSVIFPLFHVFLEPWTVVGFEATHNQAQIFREFRFLTALGGIIVLGACKLIDYLLICPGILCKILLKNDLFEKRKLCT